MIKLKDLLRETWGYTHTVGGRKLKKPGGLNEGKVDQHFNKIIGSLRKVLRKLNDEDSYELSIKLKKWFDKNVY